MFPSKTHHGEKTQEEELWKTTHPSLNLADGSSADGLCAVVGTKKKAGLSWFAAFLAAYGWVDRFFQHQSDNMWFAIYRWEDVYH